MRRIAIFFLAAMGAAAALLAAVLTPVHLRALDPRALEQGSRDGKTLVQTTDEMARRNPAVAKILLQAAEELRLEGSDQVLAFLRESAEDQAPVRRTLLHELEFAAAGPVEVQETPALTALRRTEDRERLLKTFTTSEAQRVLQNRALTNFAVFAPVRSAAGYPLDATIVTTAFLMEQGAFGVNAATDSLLKEQILQKVARGASTNQIEYLEEFYLDMFALARKFSSEQLIAFVSNVQNYDAFDTLARFLQEHPQKAATVFSALVMSRNGAQVANYLALFPRTGIEDLSFGLSNGSRALSQILVSRKPLYRAAFHNELLADPALRWLTNPLLRLAIASPILAFAVKFLFLFGAGLLIAYVIRLGKSKSDEEAEGWVPQLGLARRLTFAVVFLALVVLLGEPYLAQGEGEEKPAPRVTFPVFSAATPPPAPIPKSSTFMVNPSTLIAMGVFLVLQSSIYVFCLTKLAEIRRQALPGAMKLKLLENEENLFDAGLYLGLVGTAASLILLTLGLIKPSLVSAYSSTLFGVLFVALLKIFHVRPYRRRLIIESAAPGGAA